MSKANYTLKSYSKNGKLIDYRVSLENYSHANALYNAWCKEKPDQRIVLKGFGKSGVKLIHQERPIS